MFNFSVSVGHCNKRSLQLQNKAAMAKLESETYAGITGLIVEVKTDKAWRELLLTTTSSQHNQCGLHSNFLPFPYPASLSVCKLQ